MHPSASALIAPFRDPCHDPVHARLHEGPHDRLVPPYCAGPRRDRRPKHRTVRALLAWPGAREWPAARITEPRAVCGREGIRMVSHPCHVRRSCDLSCLTSSAVPFPSPWHLSGVFEARPSPGRSRTQRKTHRVRHKLSKFSKASRRCCIVPRSGCAAAGMAAVHL